MVAFGKGAIIGLAAVGVGMGICYAVEAVQKKPLPKWGAAAVALGTGAVVGGIGFKVF